MSTYGIRDVPCRPCQDGYNTSHVCDMPDYCSCDRRSTHVTERSADLREILADFGGWRGDDAEDAEWAAEAYLRERSSDPS